MFYSMPAMIAEALCCAEALESGNPAGVTMTDLNYRFRDLMHIMGVGYGFLWNEKRHLIEELWRCNDLADMAGRAMRYYGRDFLWLTEKDATPAEAREMIMWSVDRGRPVVMEWAGGIPEFSAVCGYEDGGDTLAGWTYCEECAARTDERGMFVNPARWDEAARWNDDTSHESPGYNILIIGDKREPAYTDKDSIAYALEILNRNEVGTSGWPYGLGPFAAETSGIGDGALRKWLKACDTVENTVGFFSITDIYTYGLYQNSIYAQKCIQPYYRKLGERSSRGVYENAIQIGIAIDIIDRERNGLEAYKDEPEKHAEACRRHIENLIKHRESMRGRLGMIYEAMR